MLKSALAAAMVLGCVSAAAAKPLSGNYTLSYFLDPGGSPGAVYCLTLTQTGSIAGFSNSGTWTDSYGVFTNGEFLVDGASVHLLGLTTVYGDAVEMIGNAKKGAFDDYVPSSYDINSGTYTLTKGCTQSKLRPSLHHTATH